MFPSAQQASQDERLLAAAAHGSALLPLVGIIVPLNIWITQREWSKFVRFHALQALAFQLVVPSISLVIYLLGIWGLLGSLMSALPQGIAGPQPAGLIALRCLLVMMVAVVILFSFFSGVVAAARILAGRDFFYPYIGWWLTQQLRNNDQDES